MNDLSKGGDVTEPSPERKTFFRIEFWVDNFFPACVM